MKQLFAISVLALVGVGLSAKEPIMVGHRGSDIGVESSVEALENGARRGYAFIESDVRVTADTAFVLAHDETTERLGSGLVVAQSTLAQLQADTLRQTRWDVPYTGRMATLGEMLDICRRYNVRPLIELKWATGINSNDQSNIPALISFITTAGMRDKAMILTSMKPCLEYIRTNYPDVECQLLVQDKFEENLQWCIDHGMGIDVQYRSLTEEGIRKFHDAGLPVNVWTVNDPSDAARFAEMGVDFITTDRL